MNDALGSLKSKIEQNRLKVRKHTKRGQNKNFMYYVNSWIRKYLTIFDRYMQNMFPVSLT